MSTASTHLAIDGVVASFTFNRPEARNAMTWEMYDALVAACDRVDDDETIRVLICKGAGGKAFIAGTDIAQFRNFNNREDGLKYEERLDHVLDRVRARNKADNTAGPGGGARRG